MTAIEPQISDNGRYRVIDVCNALEIHRNTLKKYTDAGLIRCYFHKGGKKRYKGSDVKKFWRDDF